MATPPVPDRCFRKHLLDEANTYIAKTGKWYCRTCGRENVAKQRNAVRVERERKRLAAIEARPVWPDVELAWAAGLFEGEGTVTMVNGGREGYVRSLATVTSTDPDVLESFMRMWPGQFRSVGQPTPRAREAWKWTVEGDTLIAFLLDLRPHIRTPRVAAKFDLLIEVQRIRRPGSRDPNYKSMLQAYRERMRVLNLRGVHGPPAVSASIGASVPSR
jgi:hypothetical protein